MINRIKGSLTIKIFILTSFMLFFCCAVTYGFIAWLMPKTYSADLDTVLNQKVHNLIADLEKSTINDSDDLFDLFVLSNDVIIQLYDSSGRNVPIPTNMNTAVSFSSENTGNAVQTNIEETNAVAIDDSNAVESSTEVGSTSTNIASPSSQYDISTMSAAQNYYFTFSDSEKQYKLTVLGGAQAVNQVTETLGNILPWLALVIFSMSIIGSLIYAYIVTRPVVKLSGISKKMSTLDLDWHCDESRTDELGVLALSLNNLSRKLSNALFELQDANVKLQNDIDKEKKLEQTRLAFFSAVSHELKTPITIIKGQLEGMLLGVGTYTDRDKYLARSLEVAIRLESMVQEILTVSRMESTDFVLHLDEFNFGEMVKRILLNFEDFLIQKSLVLYIEIEDELFLKGDKALLQKVVNNLVANAFHYSKSGSKIFINAWKSNEKIHFVIENTGAHISEIDLPKLFEAFYRVEHSRNRQTGGSGLGLYIVKMILDQHNALYKIENTSAGVQFSISFD